MIRAAYTAVQPTLANVELHVQRFLLRSMNPLAPAWLLRKHLLRVNDLERRSRT